MALLRQRDIIIDCFGFCSMASIHIYNTVKVPTPYDKMHWNEP